MTNFRKRIKKLCKQHKISIAQVAEKAGIHPQSLYNYLAGRSDMLGTNLEKILDIFPKIKTKRKSGKKSRRPR